MTSPASSSNVTSSDADPGLVPWVLASMTWVFVPFLPLGTGCLPAVLVWASLLAVSITAAITMVIVRAVQARPPSTYTRKALMSAALQAAIAGLYWLIVTRLG